MTEILATEATLSTLRVEIKALTVSGKQMTLAVFRQLPWMNVTTTDAELWTDARYRGTVRYAIKEEGDLWAVIEREGKLYRGPVEKRNEHYYGDGSHGNAALAEAGRQQSTTWQARTKAEADLGQKEYPQWSDENYAALKAERDQWVSRQKERIDALKAAEAEADRRYVETAKKYAQRHNEAIAILRALPQLYIAV